MSGLANFMVTFVLCTVAFLIALLLNTLGDAITLVGSTTNPTICFVIPILFYWRLNPEVSVFSREKGFSLFVLILMISISIIDLIHFFLYKQD
jgi:amino acid permease